jgi:phage tail sheath protein FI
MPVTLTYPGVYIQEIPSGVRTISGVATSITAFVGRALRGPVDDPVTLNSYADFERTFGGLWAASSLGFAVRDFFLNGGGQAIIVRLYNPSGTASDSAALKTSDLSLEAASPGAWGNGLRARVDQEVREGDSTLFNLTVYDHATGQSELFRNVSYSLGHPRQLDRVLREESRLARAKTLPTARPVAHAAAPTGKSVWDDDTSSFGVADADKGSDGDALDADSFVGAGKEGAKQGLYALERADLFNMLCLPPYTAGQDVDDSLLAPAVAYCERRRAILLVDSPSGWSSKDDAKAGLKGLGLQSANAAIFFPRLRRPNPLRDNQIDDFAPCGAVAGVIARTDAQRGIWKAPAGLDAALNGVVQLSVPLTDAENGELNPLGINCLRVMPAAGAIVWGARTLKGDDRLASEWKYLPVRRLALYIEESLYRGTQWVVFESNDEPLWAQIRLNLGAFMQGLFRQGAFQGKTPRDAYFIKCDKETTTQSDINLGIVNIVVGFAPLKPAEFVVISLQQMAGQLAA